MNRRFEMPEQTSTLQADQTQGQSAEQHPAKQDEFMIPKSRFDEVNKERQALAEKLSTIEAAQKAETEKRLQEQSQFKELAEKRGAELVEAKAKADQVDAYEYTLQKVLDAQIEALPEDKRTLVPEALTTQQKLDWLAKNAAILKAPAAFDIGAGKKGGDQKMQVDLTPEEVQIARQFGLTLEEYAKNKK
jgi:small-conductance mechanosensitive channel